MARARETRKTSPKAPRPVVLEAPWKCPRCRRSFTRENQRHACGTGDRSEVLRNRPEALVELYASLESFAKALGPIEIVARERYILLRSTRIFADLVIMTDALRVAVHLRRKLDDPIFFKVVSDGKKVTHVAKLRTAEDLRRMKPYVQEAYDSTVGSDERRLG